MLNKYIGLVARAALLIPIGMGLMFLVVFVLARTLTINEFGLYNFVIQTATFLAIIVSLGLPNLAQKQIPAYKKDDSIPQLKHFSNWMLATLIWVCTLLLLSTGVLWASNTLVFETRLFYITLTAIPFVLWLWQRYTYLGHGMVSMAIAPRDIFTPILFISLILFIKPDTAYETLYIFSSSLITCLFISVYCSRGLNLTNPFGKYPRSLSRTWYSSAFPMVLTSLMQLGIHTIDLVLIGIFTTMQETGYYTVAMRLALLSGIVIRILNTSLSHKLSELCSTNRITELKKLVNVTIIISTLWSLAVYLIFVIYGKTILSFFGSEYTSAYKILIVLGTGQFVSNAFGPIIAVNNMIGNEKRAASVLVKWLLIALCVNLVTISLYGSIGVAIISSTCVLLIKIELYLLYRTSIRTAGTQ